VTDPRSVEIPDSVLELVPATVARECCVLPVSDDGRRITLLCPADSGFRERQEEKLKFILNREILLCPVDEGLLREAIEMKLPPRKATITNCLNGSPKFRFQCPKVWSALTRTSNDSIRFCTECQRDVHWCETSGLALRLGKTGKCVAVADDFMGMIQFEDEFQEDI
jgi:hypothetical protein